jgi:hypothetical protein
MAPLAQSVLDYHVHRVKNYQIGVLAVVAVVAVVAAVMAYWILQYRREHLLVSHLALCDFVSNTT